MPGAVERDGPHGAAARRTRRVQPLALGAPRLLELPLAPLGAEISARHERHAVLERELFRALGHEQYVRALLHHEARELHRVLDVADRRDRPGARPVPVHGGGVELGIPLVVQHRATAGVELRIVLHDAHRGHHRIERGAATLEDRIAGIERRREARAVGGGALRGHLRRIDDARPAVDDDRERARLLGERRRREAHAEQCEQFRARHRFPSAAMIDAASRGMRACPTGLPNSGRRIIE